jgi:hypothetical protein
MWFHIKLYSILSYHEMKKIQTGGIGFEEKGG